MFIGRFLWPPQFDLEGNTFCSAIILCPLPYLLPTLLDNQTQMVPGTDTSSLCFALCESDGAISSQEAQK